MSTKIMVEPAQLESASHVMKTQIQEYEANYRRLFQIIEQMQSVWQGKDNIAYTASIKDFLPDFQKMQALMHEYAQFLMMSAKAYQNAQEERMQQARSLMR